MGIKFHCDSCGKKLNVKAFLAGKRGICPHCGSKISIPANAAAVQTSASVGADSGVSAAASATASPTQPAAATVGGSAAMTASPRAVPTGPAPGAALARPAGPAAAHAVAPAPAAVAPAGFASDPISEAPHAVWYVRPASGNQFGPAAADIMRRWIAEGRVAGDSLVWREGWADWKRASTVFPNLAGGGGGSASHGGSNAPGLTGLGSGAAGASYRARPRKSSTMVVAMLVVLAIASIGLLAALVAVLGNWGQ
jgi:hypothetical protein